MGFLAACGHNLGTDFGWPGVNGTTICYSCFAAEADDEWWQMVEALEPALLHPAPGTHPGEQSGDSEVRP